MSPLLIALGMLVTGVATVAVLMPTLPSSPPGGHAPPGVPPSGVWMKRVVQVVVAAESGSNYGAQNRNTDGAGLSYGLIQWTQKHGNLGLLLRRLHQTDAAAFEQIFGPDWQSLLTVTNARSTSSRLGPVGGVVLWQEPWTGRFTAASKHPPFQTAQWTHLFEGDHWQGAVKVARLLGVHTERSYALFFDRSVHQGPAAARQIAEATRDRLTRNGAVRVSADLVLRTYAQIAAARLQRVDGPGSSGEWQWNAKTKRWHRFAGPYDLFAITAKRTAHILTTHRLSDRPLS